MDSITIHLRIVFKIYKLGFFTEKLGFYRGHVPLFLLQLRHCTSQGHGGLFSLLMPRFSLTPALILLFSGHGGLFLLLMPRFSLTPVLTLSFSGHGGLFSLLMPRFSLTPVLTLLFSGHDNPFHSPMPLTLFSSP